MALAVFAVGVVTSTREERRGSAGRSTSRLMACPGLGCDLVQADPFDPRGGSAEVGGDDLTVQAHGLEHLGASVATEGRDPHLGYDLQQALAESLDVVVEGGGRSDVLAQPVSQCQVDQSLEGEVGVYGRGAVAQEKRHVHDLARLAGLDDDVHARPPGAAQEMLVDGGDRQQGGYRHDALG